MRMGFGDRGLARRGRPAGVSVGGGDAGRPRVGETLSSLDVAGRFRPVVAAGGSSSVGTANPVGSNGPVVTCGPIGLCETLSPLFQSALEPLEHSVPEVILERSSRRKLSALEHLVPDEILERSSRKKLSALEPLEHSVPEVILERSSRKKLSALDPLEHSGLDQAGPVGRQFAYVAGRSRPVVAAGGSSSVGTANPVGSDGPVVTGSPIGPCETLSPFFSVRSGTVRAFGPRSNPGAQF